MASRIHFAHEEQHQRKKEFALSPRDPFGFKECKLACYTVAIAFACPSLFPVTENMAFLPHF